jgi:hypothetical protein
MAFPANARQCLGEGMVTHGIDSCITDFPYGKLLKTIMFNISKENTSIIIKHHGFYQFTNL